MAIREDASLETAQYFVAQQARDAREPGYRVFFTGTPLCVETAVVVERVANPHGKVSERAHALFDFIMQNTVLEDDEAVRVAEDIVRIKDEERNDG